MKKETAIRLTLLGLAMSTVTALAVITTFILKEGVPVMFRQGPAQFLFGTEWRPSAEPPVFGVWAMIVGSFAVTAGALAIGFPVGLGSAIFLSEFAPRRIAGLLKPALELLAGIPSVVFGFMGMLVLLPWIRAHVGGPGASVLAGSIILGIMILPTVISISMDALRSVPRSYREGSFALGATGWQTTWRVTLPAARAGLVAAVILGMGRAVGETMAVIMVTGNTVQIPRSITQPVRTLTSNIALEMNYADGEHREALFATGVVLFAIIMILNTIANAVSRLGRRS
ncbi:MAG: phosphate ABC transporter permease subunit PstC [Candidatus Brocadiae bacterium]|nr:phosphate ABC transporter permease subunit PstC [Candidatus Brocadiia bacterium]